MEIVSKEFKSAIEHIKEMGIEYKIGKIRYQSQFKNDQQAKLIMNFIMDSEDNMAYYFKCLNGCKVKNTPQEEILECYEAETWGDDWNRGYQAGIRETLNIFEIKVKGINC